MHYACVFIKIIKTRLVVMNKLGREKAFVKYVLYHTDKIYNCFNLNYNLRLYDVIDRRNLVYKGDFYFLLYLYKKVDL